MVSGNSGSKRGLGGMAAYLARVSVVAERLRPYLESPQRPDCLRNGVFRDDAALV